MSERRRRSRSRSRERPRISRAGERETRDAKDKARSKSPAPRREVASVAVEKENVPVERKEQPKVDREKVRYYMALSALHNQ